MIRSGIIICILLVTTACSTQHPTHFYSLGMQTPPANELTLASHLNLGIFPVILPDMLDRSGIVTQKNGAELQVASHHVWAGDLQESLTQTITELLSSQLNTNNVYAGPWDARFRPEYQVQIEFQKLLGKLGEQAYLKVHWHLLGDYGKERLFSRMTSLELPVSSTDYADYVSSLDRLITQFVSSALAPIIHQHMVKNQALFKSEVKPKRILSD